MQRFWIVPLAAITGLVLAKRYEPDRSIVSLVWLVPAGFLGWTLLEYVLHRFVFHVRARNLTLRRIVDALHQEHHAAPRNAAYLFVRSPYAIGISAVIAAGLAAASGSLFSTAALMCGIWGGFLLYESTHYRIHLTAAERGWIGHRRGRHFYHHFHNPTRCFGVTTTLWDRVFRTHNEIRKEGS